jgi:2-polyprenyl-3-methyl-5-hydroxy-6-metoxy-1,4-benzoquinol methylase
VRSRIAAALRRAHGLAGVARARSAAAAASAADDAAWSVGGRLARAASTLLLFPYRHEHVDVPAPLAAGGARLDVVDDLVRYTSLSRAQVEALLSRRHENFRVEWITVPPALRDDTWFYLSSRLYLFANAVHVHDSPRLVDDVAALVPDGGRVLEFGGGTGNLALALAARGVLVDYLELSALQKDFVRFRVDLHGLHDRVAVLDWWSALVPDAYDLVCAFDVFEHLPQVPPTLDRLVASMRPHGLLVESSPFSASLSNPMHHDDPGFDRLLQARGLELVRTRPDHRVWELRGSGEAALSAR